MTEYFRLCTSVPNGKVEPLTDSHASLIGTNIVLLIPDIVSDTFNDFNKPSIYSVSGKLEIVINGLSAGCRKWSMNRMTPIKYNKVF